MLDAGLCLFDETGVAQGEHRAALIAEKGAALVALKRWQDALADYDKGLKTDDLDNSTKALMERGRGMALTELKRLDDAEAAYNQGWAEFDTLAVSGSALVTDKKTNVRTIGPMKRTRLLSIPSRGRNAH